MTETEYLKMETLTRLHAATDIIHRIVPGYGLTKKEISSIVRGLDRAISRVVAKVNISINNKEKS